jgi:hypothetical protein
MSTASVDMIISRYSLIQLDRSSLGPVVSGFSISCTASSILGKRNWEARCQQPTWQNAAALDYLVRTTLT